MHQATHPAEDPKQTHVHPFIAWTAIANFALIFSLAPSVILAQSPSPEMSSGSAAVATAIPESTFVNHAKKLAESSAPSETKVKKSLFPENKCMRSCRITRGTCSREATGDSVVLHACFEAYHDCALKCSDEKKAKSEELSAAKTTYLAALESARKTRLESIKKAEADFLTAKKAADEAYAAAKESAK